jgi:hypothetical protein
MHGNKKLEAEMQALEKYVRIYLTEIMVFLC